MAKPALAAIGLLWLLVPSAAAQQPSMTAHFIDVGQAHATLLEFPCGAMLVDAGSDEPHEATLVTYLEAFFDRRTDLNRTLDVVLITHNHLDHTRSLRAVVETFTVTRYFDNGFTEGSGVGGPNWLKREVAEGRRNTRLRAITEVMVQAASGNEGLTDQDIDPFACGTVDPEVHILVGRRDSNPGWPEDDFRNQNNHSLVTRIDFNEASFLFMGDLEVAGIESLLEVYEDVAPGLDTDVLQVGHHGSHNATIPELLAEVSPRVALIPVGPWTFGQGSQAPFTTFAFGHPRQSIVEMLGRAMVRRRAQAKTVKLAERSRRFHDFTVRKAIYATGWDGTVRVVATSQGGLTVFREH